MFKKILIGLSAILLIGLLIPQNLKMPVKGANAKSYNSETFWHYPWGNSVTHKGVDIFAKKSTEVHSSTIGVVLYAKESKKGGKYVIILGPKWRLHYYAHLDKLRTSSFTFVNQKSVIGTVGTSGNAKGKPPHLHYGIWTPIPYFWLMDSSIQGWKKMFYLNPIKYIESK